jgi:hypothetical protein
VQNIQDKKMTLQEALLLVREKYSEEQKGVIDSLTADKYKQACEKFPSTMTAAHHLWARELMKGLS